MKFFLQRFIITLIVFFMSFVSVVYSNDIGNITNRVDITNEISFRDYNFGINELFIPRVVDKPTVVSGSFTNYGNIEITSFDLIWNVDGLNERVTSINDVNIKRFETYNFSSEDLFVEEIGTHKLELWISNINGGGKITENAGDRVWMNINSASETVPRKPCFEEFTSSTCPPCASFNSSFVPWHNSHHDDITLIKYQMNWPGAGDPYYTAEGGVRKNYYGVSGVPDLFMDGGDVATTMSAVNSAYNSAINDPSEVLITGYHSLTGTTISVTANITPYINMNNVKVHIVVVENETTQNTGTNGETSFTNVMMKMLPNANGTTVDLSDGNMFSITEVFDLANTNIEEFDDLSVVVFVQDSNHDILQSEYTVDLGDLSCSNITSPMNGETGVDINHNISWASVDNATGYKINVGTSNGVWDIADHVDVGNSTTYDPGTFDWNTTIFVNIIPYDDVGELNGCPSESFTTEEIPVPDCTTLISPVNGETGVYIDADISWNSVEYATSYILVVGTSPSTNDILNFVDVGNVTSYDFSSDFDYNTTIYVSILPFNESGNPSGCLQESFTTEPYPIPNCTYLEYPSNGEVDIDVDVVLNWAPAQYATGYFLTVGISPGGGELLNFVDVGNVIDYDLGTLESNTQYYVLILPYSINGNPTGCIEEDFTTENITGPPTVCSTLITPVNGATNVPLDIDLSWSASPTATGYYVSMGTTPGGTDIFDDFNVVNQTSVDPGQLNYSTTYYVRIIPYNDGGQLTGCSEESFTTLDEIVDLTCTSLTYPLDGATGVSINLDMSWAPVTGATGYYISMGTTSGGVDILDNYDVGNSTFTSPGELLNSTTYYVIITPYNSVGPLTGCDEESFTTTDSAPDLTCTSLVFPLNGATNVDLNVILSWNYVEAAIGYNLTVGTTSGGGDVLNNVNVGNNLVYDLGALSYNTTYYVTISPFNADGPMVDCDEESFTTGNVPSDLTCTSLIYPLDGSENVPVDVVLSWNYVEAATGYLLTVGTSIGGNEVLYNFDVGDVLTYDLGTLSFSTIYYVSIAPYDDDGSMGDCDEESFTTASEIPDLVCTTLIFPVGEEVQVDSVVSLVWTPVLGATGYFLTVGTTSGGSDILDAFDVGLVTSYDLDLEYSTTYFVIITPYNSDGPLNGCDEVSFTTEDEFILTCTSLTNPLNGDTNVEVTSDLSWNEVDGATGYYLTIGTTPGGNDVLDNLDVGLVINYALISGFDYNTTYYVVITPYSGEEVASGCLEESFTTEDDTDVININDSDLISIYPNPASQIIKVETELNINELFIIDNIGRAFIISGNNGIYELSAYANGVYTILVRTDKAVFNMKLVINK